jgi:hypothetical protein
LHTSTVVVDASTVDREWFDTLSSPGDMSMSR